MQPSIASLSTLLPLALLLAGCVQDARLPPAGPSAESRALEVSVEVPSQCWRVRFEQVWVAAEEVLAIARVEPPKTGIRCERVTAQVRDVLDVRVPPLPVRYVVVEHPWHAQLARSNEPRGEGYLYLRDVNEAVGLLTGARRIY